METASFGGDDAGHCAFKPPPCKSLEPTDCVLSERCTLTQEQGNAEVCVHKPCSEFRNRQAACVRSGRCMWEHRGEIGEGECSVITQVCEEHTDPASCRDQQCRWNEAEHVCSEQLCADLSNDMVGCRNKAQCEFREDGTCLPRSDCDVDISQCAQMPSCTIRGMYCVPLDSTTIVDEMREERRKQLIFELLLGGTLLCVAVAWFGFKRVAEVVGYDSIQSFANSIRTFRLKKGDTSAEADTSAGETSAGGETSAEGETSTDGTPLADSPEGSESDEEEM